MVEERQHGLGRGAEWFAFVLMAGASTGHKFSRGLLGTGQCFLQIIFLHCLRMVGTLQLILTDNLIELNFCCKSKQL